MTPKTIEDVVSEVQRKSEVINASLWYVNPEDIRTSITSLLTELEAEIEKMIDENDDGMWAGRQTADKILSLIKAIKGENADV